MVWWKNAEDIVDVPKAPKVTEVLKNVNIEMLGRPSTEDNDPKEEFPHAILDEACTNCKALRRKSALWCPKCGFNF